ncbi:MAG: ATP-binding protein [Succinivibrio sp.]|nr:ATP-binding protein [Succinivibrio sp.]
MPYIPRTLESLARECSRDYSLVLLTGPRQVGKSTLFEHLSAGPQRRRVSLDDPVLRRAAKSDPGLFLQLHPAPLQIDEVQYAPELFTYLKLATDRGAPAGSYWLTASQTYSQMRLSQESLAGRVAILHMSALSQAELAGRADAGPLSFEPDALAERARTIENATPFEIYRRIWEGGMPGFKSGRYQNHDLFYSSYIESYVNRDATDAIPGVDRLVFADFVRACACRIGALLNVHDIARDAGVSDDTAKRWLSVLEASEIIFYLRPYSHHLLKRTVKTPKLYFFDTGLVCHLTGYSSPEILMKGALSGAVLENYVIAELKKSLQNHAQTPHLYYYRDKDGRDLDLVVEQEGRLHPCEIKKSNHPPTELAGHFAVLDKAALPRGTGAVFCLSQELSAIDRQTLVVPVGLV